MTLPATAPKTLMTLLADVEAMFAAYDLDTVFRIGEQYADEEGNGNRIVFVPRPEIGTVANAPLRLGQFGSSTFSFGCTALIWGIGEGADRYDAAHQILINLTVALAEKSGDRVEWLNLLRDEIPAHVSYGEQFQLGFTYRYEVRRGTTLVAMPHPLEASVTVEPKELGE